MLLPPTSFLLEVNGKKVFSLVEAFPEGSVPSEIQALLHALFRASFPRLGERASDFPRFYCYGGWLLPKEQEVVARFLQGGWLSLFAIHPIDPGKKLFVAGMHGGKEEKVEGWCFEATFREAGPGLPPLGLHITEVERTPQQGIKTTLEVLFGEEVLVGEEFSVISGTSSIFSPQQTTTRFLTLQRWKDQRWEVITKDGDPTGNVSLALAMVVLEEARKALSLLNLPLEKLLNHNPGISLGGLRRVLFNAPAMEITHA